MLSSITPLGERAKGNSWALTTAAYVAGSAVGGAALGVLLAPLGELIGRVAGTDVRLALTAAVLVLTAVFEATGVPIPTIRRQVDENWLHAYRGWVYGAGFGLQLGFALVTIITSWSTWAVLAVAVLSGTWWSALAIGATFGLARGLVLLAARRADTPQRLADLHARIASSAAPTARATRTGLVVLAAATAAVAVVSGASA